MASAADHATSGTPSGAASAPPGLFGRLWPRGYARAALYAAALGGIAAWAWHLRPANAQFGACVAQFGSVETGDWHNAGASDAPRWVLQAGSGGQQAAHIVDAGTQRYDAALSSPSFVVPQRGALIEFTQHRAYSWANTVGVLEIAVGDGAFADVVVAGGRFLAGGYDGRSLPANPLGSRPAWAAAPDADTLTRVMLPPSANGKAVRLRFRIGSAGTGDSLPGWYLDDIHCARE